MNKVPHDELHEKVIEIACATNIKDNEKKPWNRHCMSIQDRINIETAPLCTDKEAFKDGYAEKLLQSACHVTAARTEWGVGVDRRAELVRRVFLFLFHHKMVST
jgi:hypothetical protein